MTIGIRNIGKGTLSNVLISQSFDPNQIQMPSSIPQKGSMKKDGLVVWEIPKIYAGQSWTAEFPVSLNTALKTGEKVITTARVSGDNIIAENDELLNKTSTLGIASLPQTGEETEKLIFILLISSISLTLASQTRRKNNVIRTV
jgi:LPXTG-motif cell wall-anchored protein